MSIGLRRLTRLHGLARLALLLACCLSALVRLPGRALAGDDHAPVLAVTVTARLPHDRSAFTQGLVYHHGEFLESTGLYGQSSVRRVDPATGQVLARKNLDATLFGEGLALCQGRLLQLTWREGLGRILDPATLRLTATFRYSGEGWGLACAGERLIQSDGTNTLRLLDARTLALSGRIDVRDGGSPVVNLNALEWVNGWLLANVWGSDRVAVIDLDGPEPGRVAAWLDLAPLRQRLGPGGEAANGMAWNPEGQRLFVTGKRWDAVFALALPELLRHPPR